MRIAFDREARVGQRDRIDFLCGSIGIEVKTKGSRASVLRQCHRYCGYEEIAELILVTTKSHHTRGIVETLQGKPVQIVYVGIF